MELTENITDSIMYPLSEIKNLAIFILLLLSCILIVTIPLFMGYIYRIIKESTEGSDILPEFNDLGQMYIDGLKYFGVGLIYAIFMIIIISILIAIGSFIGNQAIMTLMILISILLALALVIFIIPATFNMINNDGNFGSAFDFEGIVAIIQNIGISQYIIWFIVVAIIGVIANCVSSLFSWTIIIPLIINSWLYCFEARSMALLFAYE